MKRKRMLYFFLILFTMILGLSVRKFSFVLPALVNDYAGDALWALMVFWGFGFLFPRARTYVIALCSLLFSYGIECSQLYHAPWIDTIRHTTLGGLVLGYGFLWSDLIAYTIGIVGGILFESVRRNRY